MHTSCLQVLLDLFEHLVRGFSVDPEDGIHVGVVATALPCEELSELFVVKLPTVVGVLLSEERIYLGLLEDTAQGLERLCKLGLLDSAVALQVKVPKDLLCCFSLVIGTVGLLSDLFEYYFLELGNSLL